ncbi:MAG: DUF4136 domain-containing protein [Gammaproteobacteria bacterium]|nr:MAG: DUF4136 domain-containing protein [Gammaproteobacteria bacterium]
MEFTLPPAGQITFVTTGNFMYRPLRFFVLMPLAMLLAACATSVNVDYDQAVDFSRLKTFTIVDRAAGDSKDPRLDSPLMDKRIVTALEQGLKAKGFSRQDAGSDFKVSYRLDVKQEIESDSSGVSIGIGSFSRRVGIGVGYNLPAAEVQSYDRGVLTVDILSTKTGQLIWRGSSGRRLYDGSTPEDSDKLVNTVVGEILEAFPPVKK